MNQRGQALIETAVTLPVLLALFIGFLGAGVAAQAYVDLNTAVYLAAASNVTAYADDMALSKQYAQETFDATVSHDTLLENTQLTCSNNPADYAAGAPVGCQGSGSIAFHRTPLSIIFGDVPLSASATATRSPYRSRRP
jgi:Flp pilus assembly protein TadG